MLHVFILHYFQAKLDKTEVTLFFVQMRNLESFSCFDEERVLFRLEVGRLNLNSYGYP